MSALSLGTPGFGEDAMVTAHCSPTNKRPVVAFLILLFSKHGAGCRACADFSSSEHRAEHIASEEHCTAAARHASPGDRAVAAARSGKVAAPASAEDGCCVLSSSSSSTSTDACSPSCAGSQGARASPAAAIPGDKAAASAASSLAAAAAVPCEACCRRVAPPTTAVSPATPVTAN